jgi:antitoxin (DNA-binding transcriptional repressor) of toxin-antitoxin stability system
MGSKPTVTEVARNFADYVNRVAYGGERFILMRGGKAVAELVPVPAGKPLSELPELLASLPHLSQEEAESFEKDLAAARAELNRLPVQDPWES